MMKHVPETFQTMGEISRNNSKQKEIKMTTNYQRTSAVNGIKRIFTGLGLAAGVMLTQTVMAASPAPVNLGLCSNFTILAAEAVSTDGGGGIINGDVGLSPQVGSKITFLTAAQVKGTIYVVDASGPAGSVIAPALLSTAQGDLTTAYNDAKGRSVNQITVSDNIGGTTLAPGLYWSGSSLQITGDLTLDAGGDANAVWIFQMETTLTTAAGAPGNPASRVILAGGAQAKNIFWQVGSSATLGTYSIFNGTIMANVTITMDVGSVTVGRALARTGAATFNGGGSGSLPTLISQTITNFIPTNNSTFAGTNRVGLSAQADSGLTVSFTVKSGPGVIIGTTNLAFANTGLVRIVASQAGNASYAPAPNVTNTYTIIPPLSTEPGGLEIQVTPSSGSWRLTAPAGYTGPTSGAGNLAALSAIVGEYRIVYGALSGYMVPTNQNQAQFVISGVTSLFVGVYRQVSTDLAPPVITASKGTYTNNVRITWPHVAGVTGYEIWKSRTNDITTAVRIAEVSDSGAATFLYDDTDVVLARSYYYWGLAKTATQVSPMGLVSIGYAALSPIGRINDYDGDGMSDLAVYRAGYWTIYSLANGMIVNDGVLGGSAWTTVPGDYDGDGKADLAVYNAGYWSIYSLANGMILLNEGVLGGLGWTTVPGDYDGDGESDLAVYNNGYWFIYSLANGMIANGGVLGGSDWTPVR